MSNISPEYVAKVINAAPLADNIINIPQMVELIIAMQAQIASMTTERDAAVEAIQDAIAANPTELNLGNYAHDDVCKLQDEAIDVFQILNAAITTTTDKEPT